MDTLEAHNIGPSVLTLQEAMSTLEINEEGHLFRLKLKQSSELEEVQERVIRVPVDLAARNCVWHFVGVRQRAATQPACDRRVDADACTVSDGRLDADDLANSCAT